MDYAQKNTIDYEWYLLHVPSEAPRHHVKITLDADFCVAALDRAPAGGQPQIFNTDQGSQYTSESFTGRLKEACVRISMDGKGRAFDNIMIERLWRSVKYEDV